MMMMMMIIRKWTYFELLKYFWKKFHIFVNKKVSMRGCDCLVLKCSQNIFEHLFHHLVVARLTIHSRLERLNITFTSNGRREFVPRDQVSPLLVVYCLLYFISTPASVVSCNFLSIRIILSCIFLLIFYFEKLST